MQALGRQGVISNDNPGHREDLHPPALVDPLVEGGIDLWSKLPVNIIGVGRVEQVILGPGQRASGNSKARWLALRSGVDWPFKMCRSRPRPFDQKAFLIGM